MHEKHKIEILGCRPTDGAGAILRIHAGALGACELNIDDDTGTKSVVIEADQLLIAARTLAELPNLKP